jgi:hypothetical protein
MLRRLLGILVWQLNMILCCDSFGQNLFGVLCFGNILVGSCSVKGTGVESFSAG